MHKESSPWRFVSSMYRLQIDSVNVSRMLMYTDKYEPKSASPNKHVEDNSPLNHLRSEALCLISYRVPKLLHLHPTHTHTHAHGIDITYAHAYIHSIDITRNHKHSSLNSPRGTTNFYVRQAYTSRSRPLSPSNLLKRSICGHRWGDGADESQSDVSW